MSKVFARLGDGFATEISEAELMKDIEDGTREASERAKVPPLSQDEIKHLFEICKNTLKMAASRREKRSFSPMMAGRTRSDAWGSIPDVSRLFRSMSAVSEPTPPNCRRSTTVIKR